MAENPVFTDPNAYRVNVPSAPRVADRSPIFAGLGRLGETLERLGTVLYQHDQQASLLRAQVEIRKGFQELVQKFDQEPEWETATQTFAQGAQELQGKMLALGKDGRVKTAIGLDFERAGIEATAHITAAVTRKKAETFRAMLLTRAEQLQQQALTDPRLDLAPLKEQVDGLATQAVLAGALTADKAETWRLSQRGVLDYVKALATVQGNPGAALPMLGERTGVDGKEFANFTDLDPKQRLDLIAMAVGGTARSEGLADKALKDAQRKMAIELWTANADGKLTAEMVIASQEDLALDEYKQLLNAATSTPPERNDPATYNRVLTKIVNGENAWPDILQANAEGALTGPTAKTLIEMDVSNKSGGDKEAAGGPPSPFKAALKYLRGALGATSLLSRADIGQERRLEEATLDFTEWMRAHPEASNNPVALREQVDLRIKRWALVDFSDKTISQPLPFKVNKPRNEITLDDLKAAATALETARPGMSDAEYQRERQRIAKWTRDVEAKAKALSNTEEGSGPRRRP